MSMITFSDNKAGMAGLDKEKIQRIIDESSGDNFSAFAKKKQERLEKQKSEIVLKVESMSELAKKKLEREMVELRGLLEKERTMDHHCVHVDMDAFYAAVEMRDEPRLRDIPMAVGGSSMLSTSNYAARQFGVRAGMPGFIGKRLCPQLEIVPPNFDKYTSESRVLCSILSEYDPNLSMGSLDEAYLDITECVRLRSSPVRIRRVRYSRDGCVCRLPLERDTDVPGVSQSLLTEEYCSTCNRSRGVVADEVEFGVTRAEIVREMRFRVEQATGLTCSAGIAPNFMLAKVCSDKKKPNDQFELENDSEKVKEFMKDLPTRKVSGIGRVAEAHLSALGISNCGEMLTLAHLLPCAFSSLGVESMLRIGMGLGCSTHSRDSTDSRKSISIERSFSPTSDPQLLTQMLHELCEQLSEQASSKIKSASGFSLKVKLSSFDVLTRCAQVPIGCDLLNPSQMFTLGKNVLDTLLAEGKELRLLGVRLYKLIEKGGEMGEGKITVVDMLKRRRVDEEEERGEVEEEEEKEKGEVEVVSEEEGRDEDSPMCPICGRRMEGFDEREMNMHVDECLNKESIKELLISDYERREETGTRVRKEKNTQKTLLNFFSKSN